MVKFCVMAGCHDVAVRSGRGADHCRKHYRTEVLGTAGDLVRCEVISGFGSSGQSSGVTDCVTNETVRLGGAVTLDPVETNVAALVAGGIVRVVPAARRADATVRADETVGA
jgi:hypothetical protein